MPERRYENVWQKMLLEEAEAKARAEGQRHPESHEQVQRPGMTPRLNYEVSALSDFGGITQPPPRLAYDFDLGEPLAGPNAEGYWDGDIVVNGRRDIAHLPRTVVAPQDCVTRRVGWQNPRDHSAGYGYRAYCDFTDGSGGIVVGHMEPGSIPEAGTLVRRNESMGRYDNPSNGNTTGAHVHRGQYDQAGRLIRPNLPSPLARGGRRTSEFGPRWGSTHAGEDWAE